MSHVTPLLAHLCITVIGCSSGDHRLQEFGEEAAPQQLPGPVSEVAVTGGSTAAAPAAPVSETGGIQPVIDQSCAEAKVSAERVEVVQDVEVDVLVQPPIALYIMLDRSTSMEERGLWDPAVAAVKAFVTDPSSFALNVALQYFPHTMFNDVLDCSAERYGTPDVDAGPLPPHAMDIIYSLDWEVPRGGGTPIEGALRGIAQFCQTRQQARPGEVCAGVLITDGEPEFTPCEEGHAALTAIASDAFENDGIRTFTVGLQGADFTLLDRIGSNAGAVDCDPSADRFACDASRNPSALSTALANIRDAVAKVETRTETRTMTVAQPLPCEWSMPQSQDGEIVNPYEVNVELIQEGLPPAALRRVNSPEECAARAWYYDDLGQPTRIIACPQSCLLITQAGYTDVDIVLGCSTLQ